VDLWRLIAPQLILGASPRVAHVVADGIGCGGPYQRKGGAMTADREGVAGEQSSEGISQPVDEAGA